MGQVGAGEARAELEKMAVIELVGADKRWWRWGEGKRAATVGVRVRRSARGGAVAGGGSEGARVGEDSC